MNPASPEAAWQNGVRAGADGDYAVALRWLERAARLAPGDPRIALDLANIRLQAGQLDRAAAAFEALTAGADVAAGWLGLMAARRLLGAHEAAAAALQELLTRHCVPADQGFATVASAVAASAGRPGWCGMHEGGLLHIAADDPVLAVREGAPVAMSHLAAAPDGLITLQIAGAALLGSPLNAAALRRCEGVVETAGAALVGWASRPAAPGWTPELELVDATGKRRRIAMGDPLPADAAAPLTKRFGFACPVAMLQGLQPPFHVLGPDGRDILGSPVDPTAEPAAVRIPAGYLGPANRALPPPARLMIVVPVYRGLAESQACLRAAMLALPPQAGLIVVDDATPEAGMAAWLDGFCAQPKVTLIRHQTNLGFPAAANAGLLATPGCDVLLLNSDALLGAQALQTLLAAVYSRPEIGSATPFSNAAAICSYPRREGGNAAPESCSAIALDALAAEANGGQTVEIPTGVGFCLLMRHDCIARTGLFRPELFAQGYGEEVDWCLRARHRGYRHVAATGAYVAHLGGVSFGAAGQALNLRNNRIVERLYPGYGELIEMVGQADRLAPARRRLDAARFKAGRLGSAILLISHHLGGGVARQVAVEMQQIRDAGRRPILLFPAMPARQIGAAPAYPWPTELTDGAPGDYPNLRFALPEQEPELLRLLQDEGIGHVVLHHGLGHHPNVRRIAERLGCPQDIVLHDYASFCPRVQLIGVAQRYCGEPNVRACMSCVAAAGDETFEGLGPKKLLARSAREFAATRSVAAPSADASRRISRHFPAITPVVTPWEDDATPFELRRPGAGPRRIAVIGGIGIAKGFDILLECARDARQRGLPLEFMLAGSSFDDEKLLQTGTVFITGAYAAEALPEMLADLKADLAFIPSIWPETWCFTLTEAWAAGLYTLAFDLGAQAERIATTKRGSLLPLGLPPPRINEALLHWMP